MSNIKTLFNALPIVAKAIGNQYGVKVVFGGDGAFTDGKVINLPVLNENDPDILTLVNGYLDHEAAHCRFTDFDVASPSGKMGKWLTNVLEDVRIEKAMMKRYPGCRKNLRSLVAKLVDDGGFKPSGVNTQPMGIFSLYILHRLRCDVLGQAALQPAVDQDTVMFDAAFSEAFRQRLDALMFKVSDIRSTEEASDLAQAIINLMEQEIDSEDQDDDQDNDSNRDQGQNGSQSQDQNESSDNDESQDRNKASSSATDDEENTNEDEQNQTPSQDGDDSTDDAASDSASTKDAPQASRSALQKVLEDKDANELPEQLCEAVESILEDKSLDSQESASMAIPDDEEDREDYLRVKAFEKELRAFNQPVDVNKARQSTARLRSRLAGLVQSQHLDISCPSRSGRMPNVKRLANLRLSDPRIFMREEEQDGINTAVTVLLDRSCSMNIDERIKVAREAALATAFALEEIPELNASVFAFPGINGAGDSVYTLHRRHQRVDAKRFRIPVDGGTPLASAVWYAGWDLLQAQDKRKILIVMTDGEPDDEQASVNVLSRMRHSGIETFGIGIQSSISPALFPESRMIDDVRNLPEAIFGLLERKLIQAA